jgi:hypothetical protein
MPRAPSANRGTQRVTDLVAVPEPENKPDYRYSFDEYKMYYESTEKVVDRRLAINSYNYTVCTAAIVAIAALTSWTWSRPEFRLITIAIGILLPIMGILFCSLWIKQISDYKLLNRAKFEVLNDMAEHISFSEDDKSRISARPFKKEWDIVEENDGTRRIQHSSKIFLVVLQSSNMEFAVPRAFRLIFVGIIAVSVWTFVQNHSILLANVLEFPSQATPKQ